MESLINSGFAPRLESLALECDSGARFLRCKTSALIAALAIFSALSQGCGLIFGGDQRVDNKSHDYTVVRLDRDPSSQWRLISSEPAAENPSSEENADVAFEHKKTGAIISLNSVCREYRDASLEELSHYLLMGLNTRGDVALRDLQIDGVKALESNVDAAMNERKPSGESGEYPVRVRTVVLRKAGCTYDLMYIARPRYFAQEASAFERFLKGFHVE